MAKIETLKKAKINFTFKKESFGKFDVSESSEIKIKKMVVGQLSNDRNGKFQVMFHMMVDEKMKNMKLKARFDSEEKAKEFLKENAANIVEKFNLYAPDEEVVFAAE